MSQAYAVIDPVFRQRIAALQQDLRDIFTQCMVEAYAVIRKDTQAWMRHRPDGTDEDGWLTTGFTRDSAVAYAFTSTGQRVTFPRVLRNDTYVDRYPSRTHRFTPENLIDVGGTYDNTTVRVYITRYVANLGFQQAQEAGELGGWGRKPGPPLSYREGEGVWEDHIENDYLAAAQGQYWTEVYRRFQLEMLTRFGASTGVRGGLIWSPD